MGKLQRLPDGSIVDELGRIIYFSCERFIQDICLGDCCFICGAQRNSKKFNDEHVLPGWLLRKYNLHNRYITLPNNTHVPYGRYKISCCQDCNSLLGSEIEFPIKNLLDKKYSDIIAEIKSGNVLVYLWVALIFLKTHLRDRYFRAERDRRKHSGVLSDNYQWEDLHHLHCIVRSIYTGARVDYESLGSFMVWPFLEEGCLEPFDYADIYVGQCAMVRVDGVAFFAVFNDSGGALNILRNIFGRIEGAIHELQTREILAELAFVNLHIENRPIFQSAIDNNGEYYIRTTRPKNIDLRPMNFKIRGGLIEFLLRDIFGDNAEINGKNAREFLSEIRNGDRTFLFDDNGNFINTRFKIS